MKAEMFLCSKKKTNKQIKWKMNKYDKLIPPKKDDLCIVNELACIVTVVIKAVEC